MSSVQGDAVPYEKYEIHFMHARNQNLQYPIQLQSAYDPVQFNPISTIPMPLVSLSTLSLTQRYFFGPFFTLLLYKI